MNDFYSLGLLVSRASVALAKALNQAITAAGIDLPQSQFIVLRCVYFKDGLSQLEIAHILSKDAAAIKRTVDNLEEKGLVIRKQVRTLKNAVCITEKGTELMPQLLQIADKTIEEALQGINSKQRDLLHSMLNKIYSNLENTQS